jgi:hypothetical protein
MRYNYRTLLTITSSNDYRGDGGIGRRSGLKIRRWRHLVGSTPTRPTLFFIFHRPRMKMRDIVLGSHKNPHKIAEPNFIPDLPDAKRPAVFEVRGLLWVNPAGLARSSVVWTLAGNRGNCFSLPSQYLLKSSLNNRQREFRILHEV